MNWQMIHSSWSAEHSICNNIWSHSKLNLYDEDEIISGALTFIPGFQTSLPFKSWTVWSCALFSVFNSLSYHTLRVHPRCQIGESLFFVSCFIVTSIQVQVGWKSRLMKLQIVLFNLTSGSLTSVFCMVHFFYFSLLFHSQIFSLASYYSSFKFQNKCFFLWRAFSTSTFNLT